MTAAKMEGNWQGGCLCGAVRYEAIALPQRLSACSCEWCRKRTGSVLGNSVYFRAEDVAITGEAAGRWRATSDAGRWLESQFCTTCGTTVFWTLEFLPGMLGVAGGTFDDPSVWGRPQRFVFARTKPEWLHLPPEIETFETMATR